MRFLTYKQSGQKVHCSHFFSVMDLYKETGLFIFLADAFLICRDNGYDFPEDLLFEMTKHFREFVNAEKKEDGLAALGFDSNKDGGAWQGNLARSKEKQAQILSLVNDLQALTNNKNEYRSPTENKQRGIFNCVALLCGTTQARVKTLFYKK